PSVQYEFQLSVALWLRAALWKRCHWCAGQTDRRLAMERDRQLAERVPIHAFGGVQYFWNRRLQSIGYAELESQFPWSCDSGKTGSVVRSKSVCAGATGNLRERGSRGAAWAGPVQSRHIAVQADQNQRALQSPVPCRDLQYSQSPELRLSERGHFLRRHLQFVGGCHHKHVHNIASDPVRLEAAILNQLSGHGVSRDRIVKKISSPRSSIRSNSFSRQFVSHDLSSFHDKS